MPPDALAAIRLTEVLLVEARRRLAALEHREALGMLARARAALEARADVPGTAVWLAEVEVATAIAAYEMGLVALARQSLARAATLDPSRELGAAEVPPDLLRLAMDVGREQASAPVAELHVRSDPPLAVVHVGDLEVGRTPTKLRLAPGRYLLRLAAADRRSWATLVDAVPGSSATIEVRLSPHPVAEARGALEGALRGADPRAVESALAELGRFDAEPRRAWLGIVGPGSGDRLVLLRCDVRGCGPPLRVQGGRQAPELVDAGPPEAASEALGVEWDRALAWLVQREGGARTVPRARSRPIPMHRRWWFWAAGTTVVAALVAGVAWLTRPEPETRRRIEVGFGEGW